jgi:hypothetical protein
MCKWTQTIEIDFIVGQSDLPTANQWARDGDRVVEYD